MEIRNDQDMIDSRDVIERVEELEELRANAAEFEEEEFADEERAELAALTALAAEAADYSGDWEYGDTLIRDSYFVEYAQELAEDVGAVPSEYTWPTSCIDWERAARELQYDYTAVDFDGVTYWVR